MKIGFGNMEITGGLDTNDFCGDESAIAVGSRIRKGNKVRIVYFVVLF